MAGTHSSNSRSTTRRTQYATSVQINLWDGLTSVPGYGPIRFMDATFYKTAHLTRRDLGQRDDLQHQPADGVLQPQPANWAYASSRVDISPFAWIDGDVANEGAFTAPRAARVRRRAARGVPPVGHGRRIRHLQLRPGSGHSTTRRTRPRMQAASIPGTIDNQPPGITVNRVQRTGDGVVVSGTATDDMAVSSVPGRPVRASGAAPMTWSVTGGSWSTGYQWHMDWTAYRPGISRPGDHLHGAGQQRNTTT